MLTTMLMLAMVSRAATAATPQPYDPARDAATDIQRGIEQATRSGKRVLVQVGGNWCGWCRMLESFFEEKADVLALREANFVLVKVNWSPENRNARVLANYPKISHYPHFFVLDDKGRLLHSQDVVVLEEGKGWGADKIRAFLERWAPKPKR